MFELFSDILTCRDNALTRLEPRTKVVIAFTAICAVLLSSVPALPLFFCACALAAMLVLRLPAKLVLLRVAAPLGMVAMLFLLQLFMTGATPWFSFTLAGFKLTAYTEGAHSGLLLGARVLGCVSVMLLLSAVTPAHRIFHALRWFGFPKGWVEIAMLMYRYAFALVSEANDVLEAQALRLGYSTSRRALSSVGVLAGTVLIRSIDQSLRTYEAMTLRGYRGSIPFGPLPKLNRREWLLLVLLPLAISGLFVLQEWRLW